MDAVEIFQRYEPELRLVEKELHDVFSSDVALIPAIGRHILNSGGKRLRPLYLILSAELAGYTGKGRAVFGSIIEAIHNASLLHDDIVDGAEVRRGKPTSHSLWGNEVVVLVGDFLYANSLRLAVEQQNLAIMHTISDAVTRMTEGEILQLQKIADPSVTEQEYLKIISSKTGVLISAACRIGALLGNVSQERVEALSRFGLKTGIVFQMFDDILDYKADEERLGKILGKDLNEGKITLPLIYLLDCAQPQEREQVTQIIKSTEDASPHEMTSNLAEILGLFKRYGVIEKTMQKAIDIANEAKGELSVFDDCPQKDALILMADYALKRKK
ncbi:MAG: polyprenyl synthetase family protein [Nitrospirae bacterium]|nr:polyprenyl synthetase family protein [Nitrospirota bacterium]MBF0592017.1 polyprenyl synthetase family protein [Nitrospirota bacterium]